MKIEPAPSPEEAAAIIAVLETLEDEPEPEPSVSRWELAGRLGRSLPPERGIEGSLWTYVDWGT